MASDTSPPSPTSAGSFRSPPYDYFEPYLARVRNGETNALLSDDRVLMFALTSGTTAARKTIPITPRYLADYRRGWNRWGLRALLDHQRISCAPILQLAGDPEEFRHPAGIPCGSLSGLTVRVQKRLIRFLYCMPAAASPIKDTHAKYYVALRLSLGRPVGMITAANPSTLAALARLLNEEKESLLRDLRDGTLNPKLNLPDAIRADLAPYLKRYRARARQFDRIAETDRRAVAAGRLAGRTGCCSAPGPAAASARICGNSNSYYGKTYVRDLGLVASEGRMTIPLADGTPGRRPRRDHALLRVHPRSRGRFAEPDRARRPRSGRRQALLHPADHGRGAVPLSHPRSGPRRRVPRPDAAAGVPRQGPALRQPDRREAVRVPGDAALADVTPRLGVPLPVYTVAPIWDDEQPYYGLFVERAHGDDAVARGGAAGIRRGALGEANDEYRGKRSSGRLGPVRMQWLPPGTWAAWDRDRLAKAGGPPEQYKQPCLIGDVKFRDSMPVLGELRACGCRERET